MNSIKHRFTLDMHSAQSQISLPALLGDTGRSWHINFSDGGIPYFIETGCLAKLTIARPTGTHIEEFCEIVNNSTVVYHFAQNENTCAVEGIHECDVTLYGLEGEYIASSRFSMIVSERVIRSDDINVTDEDRTVVEAMVTAEAQRQAAEALRVEAEAERVANEQRRQEASGTILAKAEEVAVLREKAANASDLAVTASNVATESADTATTMAQNAVNSASNAEQSELAAKAYEELARSIASDSVNMDARISRTNKLISNIAHGITAIPVETDDSVAYAKVVPSNALPYAEVIKVGGMTRKSTNLLNIADFTLWTNKVVNSDGSLSVTTGSSPLTMVKEKTGEFPSGTYTFSNLAGGLAYVQMGQGDYTHPVAVGQAITFTYDGVSYLRFIYVDQATNTTVTYKVMFNEGSTALPHEPYFEGLRDGKVTEVKCGYSSLPIPAEIQALDGYGEGVNADCYNYIDFEKRQFVKRVGKVDLGSLRWYYATTGQGRFQSTGINTIIASPITQSEVATVLCKVYDTVAASKVYNGVVGIAINTDGGIWVYDPTSSDATAFQTAMSGVMLYYELATPEIIDLSNILTDDNMVGVEGGGTITFENEHQYAVPSSITYMLKGAK